MRYPTPLVKIAKGDSKGVATALQDPQKVSQLLGIVEGTKLPSLFARHIDYYRTDSLRATRSYNAPIMPEYHGKPTLKVPQGEEVECA
jgi:hypothetical protein